jgi:TnpA family transposase
MTTIKLKKVSASQLFKRLSSYAKDNPLYKAIKEFGRVIKSLFILTYYDDVKLRQRIEKQLNRIELSNKFSNAVFYANNSEFKQGSPDEQNIAVACKVLIQNAIVLWNYLYLSQLLANCNDENECTEMVGMIKEGSMINWAHINLHGEFDFKRQAANDTPFDMRKILSLQLAGA